MSGERQLCRKPFTVILALSFHNRKLLARFNGDASLSLSMTFTCHSEPTPSRVLCRTRLFGHSRGAKEEKEVNRGNRPTRNFRANESKMENSFSICRVPQKISLAESLTVCLRFFGVTPLRMIIMSFRARPIGRRGISYKYLLGRRFFKTNPFRMTPLSSRTKVRDLLPYVLLTGDSSLRLCYVQNDNVP